MAGRRSCSRFVVAAQWHGGLRVLREAVVRRGDAGELLAVSHLPGISGEEMSLDLTGGGAALSLRVRVVESRPVIVEGAVRHRIRLAMLTSSEDATAMSEDR